MTGNDNNDDEKPTVVLDFNAIKAQLNAQEDILANDDVIQDLEFATDNDLESNVNAPDDKEVMITKKVYAFSYKTRYFAENKSKLTDSKISLNIIQEVKELNEVLTNDPNSIIIFYYNSLPKAVNQLSAQIKEKFPNTKTLIIAKNLSTDKAQQHRASKFGANAYLNDPFKRSEFLKVLKSLE